MSRFTVQDHFFHEARRRGYRARSVFKLEEIDKKMHLIKKGDLVLDLGAAPGSWLQYFAERVGDSGTVVGVDLQEIENLSKHTVQTYVYDVFSDECKDFLTTHYGKFTIIASDMAPHTSGIKDKDQWESVELSFRVMDFAKTMLLPGGCVVIKIFRGADFDSFWSRFKKYFKQAKIIIPQAVRSSSMEVYVVGKGFIKK